MSTLLRPAITAASILSAALLLAGCASSPGDVAPTSTGTTGFAPPVATDDGFETDAAWLDDGRMVAVVTWGSSTCIPRASADGVVADGQSLTVTLTEVSPSGACTADLVPRATPVTLPAGIDPTQDVELHVTLASSTSTIELDGNETLNGTPGDPTIFEPSAAWFDDASLVLLTWGSSSCPPVVEGLDVSGNTGTVTFATPEGACTADMGPRATVIEFGDLDEGAAEGFVLTLVGDGLDGTVPVLGE